MPSRFIHPTHARGIRSPTITNLTSPLSNRKITHYIRLGKYGPSLQAAQLRLDSKPTKASDKPVNLSHLL